LKVGVFVKPDCDPAKVVFDKRTNKINTANLPLMLNASDRNAIEIALNASAKTCVFCLGQGNSEPVLREALAFGINDAYLIENASENFILEATLLAKATSEVGIDAVIFGNSALDYGYTGIAEATANKLKASFIANISSLEFEGERAVAIKVSMNKSFRIAAELPCVLTANRAKARRHLTPTNIRNAYQKKIVRIKFDTEKKDSELIVRGITPIEKPKSAVIKGEPKQVVNDAIRLMQRML